MKYIAAIGALLMLFAATAPPGAAQDAFGGFIVGLRDVCAEQPARNCTRRAMAFLDRDKNGQMSLSEFDSLRAAAKSSVENRASGLSAVERNLVSVALLTLQQAKPGKVFAAFDANGDKGLSEDELFADFRLDERPLAKIVADPSAVDWNSFAARFGKLGFLVLDLLPPSYRK